MLTPYDWQESIGHRAQFIESRLLHGIPVIAVSLEVGILHFTFRRQARKLFEIYDRVAMGAIGQQSDVEAIRMASIDFAHQEGFNRSEQDVTIQRVVNAISGPIKRSFADFSSAPVVAQALFTEVGATPAQDQYVMLDYDGDFHQRRTYGYVAPSDAARKFIEERMSNAYLTTAPLEAAIEELNEIVLAAMETEETTRTEEVMAGLSREIAILDRSTTHVYAFRYLTEHID